MPTPLLSVLEGHIPYRVLVHYENPCYWIETYTRTAMRNKSVRKTQTQTLKTYTLILFFYLTARRSPTITIILLYSR